MDDLNQVAIDLWMGASPTYTHRMRSLMGIEGDDVPTIMKALQLDVGFVHQYMDVHYQVNDPLHGEFWLAHCGALLNTEPHGEERVVGMCHTIEDPTFDATAYTTNPARAYPSDPPAAARAGRPRAALPLDDHHRSRQRAGRPGTSLPTDRATAARVVVDRAPPARRRLPGCVRSQVPPCRLLRRDARRGDPGVQRPEPSPHGLGRGHACGTLRCGAGA